MTEQVRNRVQELPRPSEQYPRRYVPNQLQVDSWERIAPLYDELLERRISGVADLEQWLLDSSELQAVISEEAARRYIAMTCATDDPAAESAFVDFLENFQPRIKPVADKLNRKLVESPYAAKLNLHRYGVMLRSCRNSIELFREENIPLETELDKLSQQYQKLTAVQTVEFNGREHTLQQMDVYLEDSDRDLRRRAWELATERRLQDAEALDELFDKMLELRMKVANNAGFDNYRDYMFRVYERFDYTPEDCVKFHDAVAKHVVPIVRDAMRERKEALGVETLRPFDTACDPHGRDALRPFDNSNRLADGCLNIFSKVDAELGEQFREMVHRGLLDLDSRKGKAPGGYQEHLNEVRLPFIFTNAVGVNRDVFTLLHEGGHAFHNFATRMEPLLAYRHAPIEFCEVASMSMELLSMPHLQEFYPAQSAARTAREEWQKKIALFPWCAQVDAFQHWIYTHPAHSKQERGDYWIELTDRFGAGLDHSGYERALRYRWQAQLHIFEVPFYYIEYGIALLGAMQVWSNSLKEAQRAVDDYKAALRLGGSRPLPELFRAANIRFDFSENTIQPLMTEVRAELKRQAALEK